MKKAGSRDKGLVTGQSIIPERNFDVAIVAPRKLSPEKEEKLREFSEFGCWVLETIGIKVEPGTTRRSGVEGFSFQSQTQTIDEVEYTTLAIWFHPDRERPETDDQYRSVAEFRFRGHRFNDETWELIQFADHFRWQDTLKALIPRSSRIIESIRDDMDLQAARAKERIQADEALRAGASERGRAWRRDLAHTQKIEQFVRGQNSSLRLA